MSDARGLLEACRAYREYRNNPSKKYPATLADLLKPPFGPVPFVPGQGDLTDPWGHPYRYAAVPNEKGEVELYVWAERTVEGKLQLHGAKLEADGAITLFGQPPS